MGSKIEKMLNLATHGTPDKKEAECLPLELKAGQQHEFLKEGQRCFWLKGEIPLLEIKEGKTLKSPRASIVILDETHFMASEDEKIYTAGTYTIKRVY